MKFIRLKVTPYNPGVACDHYPASDLYFNADVIQYVFDMQYTRSNGNYVILPTITIVNTNMFVVMDKTLPEIITELRS